jgi:uncharacterized membrane protein YeaQ/YmgE (transglycosylase-associated protein family)
LNAADSTLAWTAIGAAASLATMVWPFRRGAVGIFVNLVVGILGANAAALASYLVLPSSHEHSGPVRPFFAVLGALAALGIVHAAWLRRVDHRRHAAH